MRWIRSGPGWIGETHNHSIFERLACDNTVDGVLAVLEQTIALMTQDEVLAVFVDRSPEFVERRDPVHLQCGLVGVGDGLVRLNEDDALSQSGNDLLQLRAVRRLISRGGPQLIIARPCGRPGTNGLGTTFRWPTRASAFVMGRPRSALPFSRLNWAACVGFRPEARGRLPKTEPG